VLDQAKARLDQNERTRMQKLVSAGKSSSTIHFDSLRRCFVFLDSLKFLRATTQQVRKTDLDGRRPVAC